MDEPPGKGNGMNEETAAPRWAGGLALALFLVKAGVVVSEGEPEELLWTCNAATLGVGVGLLAGQRTLTAAATLWLVYGLPLWLLSMWGGNPLLITSLGTHLGGLALGLYGIRRLGIPRGTWWKAVLGLAALHFVCKLVTPPEANVNLAFSVLAGWEGSFENHTLYTAGVIAVAAVVFWGSELGLRRLGFSDPPESMPEATE